VFTETAPAHGGANDELLTVTQKPKITAIFLLLSE
jgi:hypothetical protein